MNPGLHIEQKGNCLILSGELDHDGVSHALKAGRHWLAGGNGPLQVELSGISRCESAGVALLLEWLRQARRHDRTVEFLHAPGQMRVLLKFFDLERVLPMRA